MLKLHSAHCLKYFFWIQNLRLVSNMQCIYIFMRRTFSKLFLLNKFAYYNIVRLAWKFYGQEEGRRSDYWAWSQLSLQPTTTVSWGNEARLRDKPVIGPVIDLEKRTIPHYLHYVLFKSTVSLLFPDCHLLTTYIGDKPLKWATFPFPLLSYNTVDQFNLCGLIELIFARLTV